jgi:hypothetical protein
MSNEFKNNRNFFSATLAIAFIALPWAGAAVAGQVRQPTFSSAEDAHRALFLAVQNHDDQTAMNVLGVGREGMFSGDEAQDDADRQRFLEKYREMHRLSQDAKGITVLYVGAENWPFPFPLVSKGSAWRFDSNIGTREILFRRIGENETAAIQHLQALVASEKEHNASANATSYAPGNHGPVHGYYFRVLSDQKNFAFVAYPAEYRSCGVMTFIINQDGVVHQKDLGPNTAKRAKTMTRYDPGSTWDIAE